MSEFALPDPISTANSYHNEEKENSNVNKRAFRRGASNGSGSSALSSLFESVADRDSTFLPNRSQIAHSYASMSDYAIIRPESSSYQSIAAHSPTSASPQSSRNTSGIHGPGCSSSAELEGLEAEVERGISPFQQWEMRMRPEELDQVR